MTPVTTREIEGFATPAFNACENFTNQLRVMEQHVEWEKQRMLRFLKAAETGLIDGKPVNQKLYEKLYTTTDKIIAMEAMIKNSLPIMYDLTVHYHQLETMLKEQEEEG